MWVTLAELSAKFLVGKVLGVVVDIQHKIHRTELVATRLLRG